MINFSHITPKPLALMLGLGLMFVPIASACSSNTAGETSSPDNLETVENEIRIGVLVLDNHDATRARFEPLFAELSTVLGQPVTLVPLPFESQLAMVAVNKVDFVISNPLVSVQMRRLYGTQFLATIALEEGGPKSAGLMIVKPDSPITSVTDLAGRTGACPSMTKSAAGCVFQIYHLDKKGLDPRDPSSNIRIEEVNSHDKVVEAVLNDEVEFGFVRSDQLQRMVDRGQLSSTDELRILEPMQDDYPYPHTTQLYPTWPVAALQDTPDELVEQMRQALLNIPEGHEALASVGYSQIIPPENYSEVDNLIESLNLEGAEVE